MAAESSDRHLVTVHEPTQITGSTLRASTTTVQYVLKIQGYSWMSKCADNGNGIRSRSFRVGDTTTWRISFFPNGNREDNTDFASIFVILDAAYLAFKAEIAFHILVHTTGEPVPCYRKTDDGDVCNFARVGAFCGHEEFIPMAELERVVLKDDCFSVRCDVTVIVLLGDTAPPPRPVVGVPPPDCPRHFRDLLRSERGADVGFHVGGETFAAHRCVLAARSPVFRAELCGGGTEESSVRIDGVSPEAFRNLLHFAYTDELPPAETEDCAAMACDLLKAADRYGMERLKLVCEDRLHGHIDTSTAAATLLLAEEHRCRVLKEACFEFLLSSSATADAVMATEGFDHLRKTCPLLLKDVLSKLAAARPRGRRRMRDWADDGGLALVLRTTEGDELPGPTHRIADLGETPKRMRP